MQSIHLISNSIWLFPVLSKLLICIGLWGLVINSCTVMELLINFEITILGVIIKFCSYSLILHDSISQIFCLIILAIPAAETAIISGLYIKIAQVKQIENILILSTQNVLFS